MTDELDRFHEQQRLMAQSLATAGQRMSSLGHESIAAGLEAEADAALGRSFSVAVVGEFSSGKSTLLNALLGQDLLPAKMAPCTAEALEIRYGEKPVLRVFRRGENEPELAPPERLAELSVLHAREPKEIAQERAASTIERLVLETPNPPCSKGVALLDTPGLNEADARTRITMDQLPRADASILLLRATDLLSATERAFLESEARKEPVDRRWLENAFVVVTFSDVAIQDGDEALVELRDRLAAFLDGLLEGSPLAPNRRYFVDSRSVLRTRTGRPATTDGVEFARFEADLRRFLVHERGRLQVQSQVLMATTALRRARGALSADLAAQQQEAAELNDSVRRATKTVGKERQRLERIVSDLRSRSDRFARDILADLRGSWHSWVSDLEPYLESLEYPGTVLARPGPVAEWYAEKATERFMSQLQHWSNTVPSERLLELVEDFERAHDDDLRTLRENLMGTARSLGFEDFAVDEPEESHLGWLTRSAAGWVAGGPLGAVAGNLLGWRGVVANFAVNFGVGLALGLLGLSIPVIGWIVIGAVVGAVQVFLGQEGIKRRIAQNVAKSYAEQLPAKLEEAEEAVEHHARTAIADLAEQIRTAAEGLISTLEQGAKAARTAAEAASGDRQQRARRLQEGLGVIDEALSTIEPIAT